MTLTKSLVSGFWSILIAVLAGLFAPADVRAAPVLAGVAAEEITSSAPTQPMHDPLFAKALVVDDGSTRAVLISLDLIGASEPLVAAVRRQIRPAIPTARSATRRRPIPTTKRPTKTP